MEHPARADGVAGWRERYSERIWRVTSLPAGGSRPLTIVQSVTVSGSEAGASPVFTTLKSTLRPLLATAGF